MSNKVHYEYALIDIIEGFEYQSVTTREIARDWKRSWNAAYPEAPVAIVQRKYKLESVKQVR